MLTSSGIVDPWRPRHRGTSTGRILEGAISCPSPSVVVGDVATFVYLEHGLEFTVDGHLHDLRQCGCKVNLGAEITFSNQVVAATVASVGC